METRQNKPGVQADGVEIAVYRLEKAESLEIPLSCGGYPLPTSLGRLDNTGIIENA